MSRSVIVYYEGGSVDELRSLLSGIAQVQLRCSCGATIESRSIPPKHGAAFVRRWRADHRGEGHRISK